MSPAPQHPLIPDPPVLPADYVIPTVDKPSVADPLHRPSHSGLHNRTATMVQRLNERLMIVESNINQIWTQVENARLTSDFWTVPGSLGDVITSQMLLPLVWNGSDHTVLFEAAKITMYDIADQDVKVNLHVGQQVTGGGLNELTPSILNFPMVIEAGQRESALYTYEENFVTGQFHAQGFFVAAVIEQVGTEDMPGGDLTIQLDRRL
jgi:hypothetical protein